MSIFVKYGKMTFMNHGFWDELKKPIMALAPMADVTDMAFREMFATYGKPDVMFTEFVSVDGLISSGQKNLLRELAFTDSQRPIVAQIWGKDPKKYFKAAKLIAELGFDGIDINMGCPQRKEIVLGTCAALMQNFDLTKEIIAQTRRGAGKLPVSVKTRIGYNKIETEKWVGFLLEQDLAAIILHARTKKEMSNVPAHWDEIAKAVRLRDQKASKSLIIGNGDVKSFKDAEKRIQQTSADGVMIGRGAFGNPWLFSKKESKTDLPLGVIFQAMAEHAKLFEKIFNASLSSTGGTGFKKKNFAVMRKHFKAYIKGFSGAVEMRTRLMSSENASDVEKIVLEFSEK